MVSEIEIDEPPGLADDQFLIQIDNFIQSLNNDILDDAGRLNYLTLIKDKLKSYQSSQVLSFLSPLMAILLNLLKKIEPTIDSNSINQALRLISLEILQQIVADEANKTYATEIFELLIDTVRCDNEINTILALKIVISVFKMFRVSLKESLPKFIEVVIEIYKNMDGVVATAFDNKFPKFTSEKIINYPNFDIEKSSDISVKKEVFERPLIYGRYSFKVITECPIIVVLFFQSNQELASASVPNIVDLLLNFAKLDPLRSNPSNSKTQYNEIIDTSTPQWQYYCDLLIAQVKTISFLAYLLRGHSYISATVQEPIPEVIFRLLRNLPASLSGARKELLVATRHILLTDCRVAFIKNIDDLMEESLLTGKGPTAKESLRPLALNILADLLHNVRAELTDDQIERIVLKFCSLIHEEKLPVGVQTISVKLLMNFVDKIAKIEDPKRIHRIITIVIANFIRRLQSLNISTESISVSECNREVINLVSHNNSEPIKDARTIFKTLILGLKSFVHNFKTTENVMVENGSSDLDQLRRVRQLIYRDVDLFCQLLREGIKCFALYRVSEPTEIKKASKQNGSTCLGLQTDQLAASLGPIYREEKDLMEIFSSVFISIDPATFIEVWELEMPMFYSAMQENPSLMYISQYFLANEITTKSFLATSLKFLMKNIDNVSNPSILHSAVNLRFFRTCFMTVTMFPTANEPIIVPFIADIVYKCIQSAAKTDVSTTYFLLLKYLFRAVGGGRFDFVSKEVMPLLQVLLECLNSLLFSARIQWEKELYAELCLFIPVRLSALLPYMSLLMKPLITALEAQSDLIGQGLRTLELCLDNLTKDFFDPIMSSVIDELMAALKKHLKPLPYNHQYSHNAMKILGKLGGRNRKNLSGYNFNASGDQFAYDPYISPSLKFRFLGTDVESNLFYCDYLPFINEKIINQQVNEECFIDVLNYIEVTLKALLEPLKPASSDFENVNILLKALSENPQNFTHSAADISSFKDSHFNVISDTAVVQAIDSKLGHFIHLAIESLICINTDNETIKDRVLELLRIMNHMLVYYDVEWMLQIYPSNADIIIIQSEVKFILASKVRKGYVEALTSALSKDKDNSDERTVGILYNLFDLLTSTKLSTINPNPNVCLTLRQIIESLSHSCFEELWYLKASGTIGLGIVFEKFLVTHPLWFAEYHFSILKSLLFVVKDNSHELSLEIRQKAADVMRQIILIHYDNSERDVVMTSDENNDSDNDCSDELLSILVLELSCSNEFVRELIQEYLNLIKEKLSCSMTKLIKPYKDQLLVPIFKKPLRALPFSMQISHVDAVKFCIEMRPVLLDFSEELLRLVHEALALAYADDEALMTVSRTSQYKTASLLIKLRAVCLKLLSAALNAYDFSSATLAQTKAKIIGVFFKCLYMKSETIVEVANKGLKGVLAQYQKLPKELLQGGLRPILMNISDHKRLTVENLEGLARLLELLTNYFKVEIGRKLLDHLKAWSNAQMLQTIANSQLDDKNTVAIIASILNIFHLLPAQANQFLSEIVESVLSLESLLKRSRFSPFRTQLIKYLNRYPTDTVHYFLEAFKENDKLEFFIQLLESDNSNALRNKLIQNIEKIDEYFQDSLTNNDIEQFILIVRLVVILYEKQYSDMKDTVLFSNDKTSAEKLFTVVAVKQYLKFSTVNVDYSINQLLLSDYIENMIDLRLKACENESVEIVEMQLIIRYVGECYSQLTSKLISHLQHAIFEHLSNENFDELILYLLSLGPDIEVSHNFKSFLIDCIIIPVFRLKMQNMSNDEKNLFASRYTGSIIQNWIEISLNDYSSCVLFGSSSLRFSLLRLIAFLITEIYETIENYRISVMKVLWNYSLVEDSTIKYSSLYCMSIYLSKFQLPEDTILEILTSLLRSNQSEARFLIKQSLALLSSVIPKLLDSDHSNGFSTYVDTLINIMSEDTSSAVTAANVLNFIVSHGDILYDYRQRLLSSIATVLHKLAFQPNSTAENKEVAIEVAELIYNWCERENETGDKSKALSSYDFHDQLFSFLIRLACLAPDIYLKNGLSKKSINIMENLITKFNWKYRNVSLSIFEKILIQMDPNEQNLHTIANALRILDIILKNKNESWLLQHISILKALVEKSLNQENVVIQTNLQPIIKTMLNATRNISSEEVRDDDSVGYQLRNLFTTFAQECLQTPNNRCIAGVLTVETLLEDDIALADILLPLLVKTFTKLVKDYVFTAKAANTSNTLNPKLDVTEASISHAANTQNLGNYNSSTESATSQMNSEGQVSFLLTCLGILKNYVKYLGEQRRYFLSTLLQLVERSPSSMICIEIVRLMREWIFISKEPFPSIKEKTLLLLKMTSCQNRNSSDVLHELFKLVLDVYKEPSLSSTELAVRLEQAFLIGTQTGEYNLRNNFMAVFDRSMSRNLYTRLNYVVGIQNWELIGPSYWIVQGNRLIIGSIAEDEKVDLTAIPSNTASTSDNLTCFFKINSNYDNVKTLIRSLSRLQTIDNKMAHYLWKNIFSEAWKCLSRKERQDLAKALIALLAKDYHVRQIHQRPNPPQTILETIALLDPPMSMPPHLVRYIGLTFNAHYSALALLERDILKPYPEAADEEKAMLSSRTFDALVETYACLLETDMFHGAWRRSAKYLETYTAISYEQNEIWDKAQLMYEASQIKARSGVIPFSESEYNLWEDHWIICAQKLQQWDILYDMAKYEGYNELILESAWRLSDWSAEKEQIESYLRLSTDNPSPRRYIFEALLTLQRFFEVNNHESVEEDLTKLLDDATQSLLHKWHQLPDILGDAHIPLLQNFQQIVEFQEASQIYMSLASTNIQNMASKALEVKNKLQVWRERLPNSWDDINAWGDLVAWRQHVFQSINKIYLPLSTQQNNTNLQANVANSPNNNTSSPSLYRGYHEIAWIINRFAHVARKHNLTEVSLNQLSRIYTLPNIEIQEAFLKLKEQAKCHYQNPSELQQGLDVISNTNLMYFGARQKAEFFALKGMFLTKLKHNDEANQAFATAVQIDLTLPKAWAEWGRYNDMLYSKNPSNISSACNAVSCYLQAAGLYQNRKSRKILSRVLWLLTFDDVSGSVSKAFDSYRGEIPIWYWITFIPQLLTSLSHKEARHMRNILARISKTFPQAIHFQLRTTRDDYFVIKKQALSVAQKAEKLQNANFTNNINDQEIAGETINPIVKPKETSTGNESINYRSDNSRPNTGIDISSNYNISSENSVDARMTEASQDVLKMMNDEEKIAMNDAASNSSDLAMRQPWEYVDDIISFLKTAYPLLALTMEKMVDQIQTKFKSPSDEDAYRLVVALLNDGVQYIGRIGNFSNETQLPSATQTNILRFADSVLPKHIKAAFEEEFVHAKPNLQNYVEKLRRWRDRFEYILDRRDPNIALESLSPWLCQFHYSRLDDVEIPGQYLQHKDNNNGFVKISRFLPNVSVLRGQGICYRRLTIRGHDGSLHHFAVQYPAARHCRREERILQLFRIFDDVLRSKRQTRKRNLSFDLPWAIPLAPHIRIVKDDPTYISFQNIFEEHCKNVGVSKDQPLKIFTEKMREIAALSSKTQFSTEEQKYQQRTELLNARVEILEYIQRSTAPSNIFETHFQRLFKCNMKYWLFRKAFSLNYASLTFIVYIMSINLRFPHKFYISSADGRVLGTELLPAMASNNPILFNGEAVPFRLTPNVQHLIGPIGIEGNYASALMAIAKSFSEPEFDLEQHLTIFIRDELIWWFTQQHRPVLPEIQFKEKIAANIEQIKRRVTSFSQTAQGSLPANQTIIDFISHAVNPRNLAQMDQLWAAWI